MLRSLLFAPGDSEKKMGKAAGCGADAIIVDLEDSVAAERKPLARQMVSEFLRAERAPGLAYYVRVNPLDGDHALADIAAVAPAAPTGIMLPKASGPEDVFAVAGYLDVLEVEHGLTPGAIKVLPIATETADAVFSLGDYRFDTPRLSGLTWGAEDLAAAVSASGNLRADKRWTEPFEMVRALCLFAAHAAQVQAIDTVMADFRDLERLRTVSDEARRDGFSGKMCIHPAQVDVVNQAFSPTPEELEHARAVIQAFADNPAAGTLQIDGTMIDRPHLVQAERLVALAASIEARNSAVT